MTTDQLTLDLDDVSVDTISIGSGSYTVTVPSSSSSSITTTTLTDNWTSGITLGGTTLTEEKVKVLDDIKEWMNEVDAKLAILKPNEELEEQWDELKELRNRYVELEAELTEKAKMWELLK
tara:strand:- start:108 stop:470 length:363 start_codon:yes stop_codon:yes gene_type:complete